MQGTGERQTEAIAFSKTAPFSGSHMFGSSQSGWKLLNSLSPPDDGRWILFRKSISSDEDVLIAAYRSQSFNCWLDGGSVQFWPYLESFQCWVEP